MNSLIKINKFYIGFAFILILLAGLVILSLRGIFNAMSVAGQVDDELLSSSVPRIDTQKIDEALKRFEEREYIPLDF